MLCYFSFQQVEHIAMHALKALHVELRLSAKKARGCGRAEL